MSKLLILGNGFDLQCGLATKYSDFFNNQLITNSAFKKYYHNCIQRTTVNWGHAALKYDYFISELTAWDMLFIAKNICDGNWCDIEKEIENSLNYYWLDVAKFITRYNQRDFYELKDINRLSAQYFKGNDSLIRLKYSKLEENTIEDKFTKEIFYPFLLQQLELFETRFRQYLINEVEAKQETYFTASWELLVKLLGSVENTDNIRILCFNYIKPFRNSHSAMNSRMTCVHGSIRDNYSIFGIDPVCNGKFGDRQIDWIKADDPKYIFTKTYRKIDKMASGTRHLSVADDNTDEIIFYGHSLNEQDYSYFQTLFDMLDVYGVQGKTLKTKKVMLTFYFSDNRAKTDEDKTAIRIRYVKAITALLSKYGETFSNRAHGKNLIDKLINEGRLEIKTIELNEKV